MSRQKDRTHGFLKDKWFLVAYCTVIHLFLGFLTAVGGFRIFESPSDSLPTFVLISRIVLAAIAFPAGWIGRFIGVGPTISISLYILNGLFWSWLIVSRVVRREQSLDNSLAQL